MLSSLASVSAAAVAEEAAGGAEHGGGTPHYPIHKPEQQDWSFAGPFGNYDKGQLQRGLKIYTEVCSACHSMESGGIPYARRPRLFRRTGEGLRRRTTKFRTARTLTAKCTTARPCLSDHFPSPYPNKEAAAASNNGAAPPDFSLIAKARGIERGFPQFVFDMFWPYQEGGPDYIHALLTGYHEPPEGVQVAEGTHYNPYFANASALAMAQPISNDQVTYDDGTPQTVDQYAKDVSAFLMWAAEPHLEDRKRTGFMVMVFLLIFTGLVYLTKKSVYANKEH